MDRRLPLFETHRILCRICRDVLLLDDDIDEALTPAGHVSPAVARRLPTTIHPPEHDSTTPELLLPNLEMDESARLDDSTWIQ